MSKRVKGGEINLNPSSKHDESTGLYNGKSINNHFNCLSTFKKDDVTSVQLQILAESRIVSPRLF